MKNKTVGVIGGGQLAWMMAQESTHLNIELIIQTPDKNDPAVSLAKHSILAKIDDSSATEKLAEICDVITFENEFVNLPALQKLADKGVCFYPSLISIAPLLDKYNQRCFFNDLGLSIPHFVHFDQNKCDEGVDELLTENKFDFPLVIKTRRHGYDGQGTFVVKDKTQLLLTLKKLAGIDLLIEEFINFECELAVIVGRNIKGEIVIYPAVETYQKNQVCHWVIAPFNLSKKQDQNIKEIAIKLLEKLNYVGVLGIELFLTKDGNILINEVAPRTHNSGHYTLDACVTSQFAMQLQAITDQNLGDINLKSDGVIMVNLLGYENSIFDYQNKREEILKLDNTYVHWYGKKESKVGRKLGHVTTLFNLENGDNFRDKAMLIIQKIESIWYQ